jgi:hypothetical protein
LLWTIAVVLLVPWLVGLGSAYTLGGLIHVLLVIALVVLVVGVGAGPRQKIRLVDREKDERGSQGAGDRQVEREVVLEGDGRLRPLWVAKTRSMNMTACEAG